ncbi:hypothetical protein VT84_09805 [Gemmata sp. SH-PL17]|uniref:hypothetical protein n=1 Tax=Gemmata sp. SH-PL17 TaxID=1630693 RepID=UPI0004B2241D|nr:hypothetical protein [Gemmata sp. SH-PL17]AMV24678.1 hypothetical protein VT84_09805 [Gemmata sp. SH-PL17]
MRPVYLRRDYERCLLSLGGHDYPTDYRWLRAHGFRGFTPWHCLDAADRADKLRREFLTEVDGGSIPVQDFLPFAETQHMDEVAGFVVANGVATVQVCVVHLTWRGRAEAPGWPSYQLFSNIWEWLTMACAESREWCSPEELADLVANVMD